MTQATTTLTRAERCEPAPGRLTRAEAEPGEWPNLRADPAPDDTAQIVFVIAKCAAPAQRH